MYSLLLHVIIVLIIFVDTQWFYAVTVEVMDRRIQGIMALVHDDHNGPYEPGRNVPSDSY